MKNIAALLIALLLLIACSGDTSEEPPKVSSVGQAASPSASSNKGETAHPCDLLKGLDLAGLAGADETAIKYAPGGRKHPYCNATWPYSMSPEEEAEFQAERLDYMDRMLAAKARGEKTNEKMPYRPAEYSVMLTVSGLTFTSDAAAVEALENVVGKLEDGITAETEQGSATFRLQYDDWLEGVGDKAAWGNTSCKLSVAAKGRIFHLDVRLDDYAGIKPPETEMAGVVALNQPVAIGMARRIINEL